MLRAKVIWKEEVPAEIRAAVEPHLTRWLGILPGWCEEIIMRWNADTTSASLQTDVRPEYRDVILEVCPSWLDLGEDSRECAVVHELCHVLAGPLVNFTRDTIWQMSDEGSALRGILQRECEKAFEGVVEDQARAFLRERREAYGQT